MIVLHAGTKNGWADYVGLVFKYKQHTDNCHDEMNYHSFEEQFNATLLSKISPNLVIVMDTAPYHSCRKECVNTKSWAKRKMMEWLNLPRGLHTQINKR